MTAKSEREQVGAIKFSFSEALRISYEHIHKRPAKSLITVSSITLGVAFMVALLIINPIYGVSIERNQYWLVFISLCVCVISILNSMLIAVHERYREIGTMKCLGALDQHILKLFLTESFVLSLFGGIGGFIIGIVASIISSFQIGLNAILEVPIYNILSTLFWSVALSIGISFAATLYPAYRAAKLSPVEALRHEI